MSPTPEDFRRLGNARVGELAEAQPLTVRFATAARLVSIHSTSDFRVEQGSSCVAGNVYAAKSACSLLVRFTPQGPGRRLGKLKIDSADPVSGLVTQSAFGLGGTAYAPAVSFTPSIISTVSATVSGGKGRVNGAQNLAVDGGDNLYIADTGNNRIQYLDSSGVIATISTASQTSAPYGVAVDEFGEVFFSEPSENEIQEIYEYGPQAQASGSGSDSCTVNDATCYLGNEKTALPLAMSMGASNQLFINENSYGVVESTTIPTPTFLRIDGFYTGTPLAFAVDSSDNLYFSYIAGTTCSIVFEPFYDAENFKFGEQLAAGGRVCGFSGDGGQARGAEMGNTIGQIAFDIAGNLYFSDTSNQRVRRIDASTGIIRTIAGNGMTGYAGDGSTATSAQLHSPTGVAVDSEGQVYILSNSASSGSLQVVRKVGITGILNFITLQKVGTSSGVKLINLANTGNSALTFTSNVFTGTNPGDFSIDKTNTSCNFTAGNSLPAGQSCLIGVIFKPAAAGARSAVLKLLDNTVTNVNSIQLNGTGN